MAEICEKYVSSGTSRLPVIRFFDFWYVISLIYYFKYLHVDIIFRLISNVTSGSQVSRKRHMKSLP